MSTPPEPPPVAADPSPADEPAGPVAATSARRHAFLLYNLARLAILLVALAVLYLLGFRGVALVILALVVSGAVSLVALFRLRGDAAVSLGSTWRRISERIDKGAASEDDDSPPPER